MDDIRISENPVPPQPSDETTGVQQQATHGQTAGQQTAGEPRPRSRRGFASMDRAKVSEIARKGGQAAHAAGTAHEFTKEEAREAGRKGGRATHAKARAGRDPSHA